jgi:uncharacterized protein DUF3147
VRRRGTCRDPGPGRMTTVEREGTVTERIAERPKAEPEKLREVGTRPLGYRFIAGALTSIAAGAITLAFGARVGGILLAFPAILAASLTLIEEQEDSAEAREDARGAIVGGLALAVFATVVAITVRSLGGATSLVLAGAAWLACALGGYALAWFR